MLQLLLSDCSVGGKQLFFHLFSIKWKLCRGKKSLLDWNKVCVIYVTREVCAILDAAATTVEASVHYQLQQPAVGPPRRWLLAVLSFRTQSVCICNAANNKQFKTSSPPTDKESYVP